MKIVQFFKDYIKHLMAYDALVNHNDSRIARPLKNIERDYCSLRADDGTCLNLKNKYGRISYCNVPLCKIGEEANKSIDEAIKLYK